MTLVAPWLGFRTRDATNLFAYGQCDALGAWGPAGAGTTAAVDTTVPAPRSRQSIIVVTPGAGLNEGVLASTPSGAYPIGTVAVASLWMHGVAGHQYDAWIRWTGNADGVHLVFVATGAWQLVVPPATAATVATPNLTLFARTSTQRAETFWAANAMVETGQASVAPYVPTAGGVIATGYAGQEIAPIVSSPLLRVGWP